MANEDGQYVNRIAHLEKKVDDLDGGGSGGSPDEYAKLDAVNVFTAKQVVDRSNGQNEALVVQKEGETSIVVWTGGTVDQYGTQANNDPTSFINRQNLDDAIQALDLQPPTRGNAQMYRFKTVDSIVVPTRPGELCVNGPGFKDVTYVGLAEKDIYDSDTELFEQGDDRVALEILNSNGTSTGQEVVYKLVSGTSETALTVEYLFHNGDIEDFVYNTPINVWIYSHRDRAGGGQPDLSDYAQKSQYNEFKSMQSFDPTDTNDAAIRIQEDNATTLKLFPSGLIKQYGSLGNTQPEHVVTRRNVTDALNDFGDSLEDYGRRYSWVTTHTVAEDLSDGEAFIATNGGLYMSIKDADGEFVVLNGTYEFDSREHLYYRNAQGRAVELFSITKANVTADKYIRLTGEEEVHKNHLSVGMLYFDSGLFV